MSEPRTSGFGRDGMRGARARAQQPGSARSRNIGDLGDALVLPTLMFGVFVFAIFASNDFSQAAQWFPRAIAVPGVLLSLLKVALIVRDHIARSRHSAVGQSEESSLPSAHMADRSNETFALGWLAWISAYVLAVGVIGFMWGTPVWVAIFSRLRSGVSTRVALVWAGAITTGIWIIAINTGMRLPRGILF